ncbi:MAG TPA: hypothetical protein VH373_08950 [Jatrophihabitantaceae bacterium]
MRDYLTALARGDAAAALRAGPRPASTTFLTDEVLREQQGLAKLTDIAIGNAAQDPDDNTRTLVDARVTWGSMHRS